MMEHWNDGPQFPNTPVFQNSIAPIENMKSWNTGIMEFFGSGTPTFHHSIIPIFRSFISAIQCVDVSRAVQFFE
jgi:hypothetical protein